MGLPKGQFPKKGGGADQNQNLLMNYFLDEIRPKLNSSEVSKETGGGGRVKVIWTMYKLKQLFFRGCFPKYAIKIFLLPHCYWHLSLRLHKYMGKKKNNCKCPECGSYAAALFLCCLRVLFFAKVWYWCEYLYKKTSYRQEPSWWRPWSRPSLWCWGQSDCVAALPGRPWSSR